jgi:acyl carrier protein
MTDFIELFNMVFAVSKPAHADDAHASMDQTLAAAGIDSLDGLVMMMYLCELYGIDDKGSREWRPTTVREVYELVMAHKTREPVSVASAREQIR